MCWCELEGEGMCNECCDRYYGSQTTQSTFPDNQQPERRCQCVPEEDVVCDECYYQSCGYYNIDIDGNRDCFSESDSESDSESNETTTTTKTVTVVTSTKKTMTTTTTTTYRR